MICCDIIIQFKHHNLYKSYIIKKIKTINNALTLDEFQIATTFYILNDNVKKIKIQVTYKSQSKLTLI